MAPKQYKSKVKTEIASDRQITGHTNSMFLDKA